MGAKAFDAVNRTLTPVHYTAQRGFVVPND